MDWSLKTCHIVGLVKICIHVWLFVLTRESWRPRQVQEDAEVNVPYIAPLMFTLAYNLGFTISWQLWQKHTSLPCHIDRYSNVLTRWATNYHMLTKSLSSSLVTFFQTSSFQLLSLAITSLATMATRTRMCPTATAVKNASVFLFLNISWSEEFNLLALFSLKYNRLWRHMETKQYPCKLQCRGGVTW